MEFQLEILERIFKMKEILQKEILQLGAGGGGTPVLSLV